MSSDVNDTNSFSDDKPSANIIDLCTQENINETIDLSTTDEIQPVTPCRNPPYNVVNDIQAAIAKPSFSAMYPIDDGSTNTSNDPSLSVITPLVDKYLQDDDDKSDEISSEKRNISFDLGNTNESDSNTLLITKQKIYQSNPILKELYGKIFNKHFLNFYDYLKKFKGILLELLKVRVTYHGVDVTYKSSLVCYTTNKNQYDQIYDQFCTYDREYIPHFIVSTDTSYYNIYEDDDFTDREVISSLGLQDDFNSLMNIYRSSTTDHDSTSDL